MSKLTKVTLKIPEFKFTDSDLFEVDFNIKNDQMTESVKSMAISKDTKRMYIKMCDVKYDDLFTSDCIKLYKSKINKITLKICDREGNIIEKQDFKGKIIDMAFFDYNYARIISDILVVFEYE